MCIKRIKRKKEKEKEVWIINVFELNYFLIN